SAKQALPLCNYKADAITYPNEYHRGETITLPQREMTKAEYAKIYKDYKGTRIIDRSHKVRIAIKQGEWFAVFLTDSKVHEKPGAGPEPTPPAPRMPRPQRPAPTRTEFDDIKDSLKAGVKVVSAPQLFPTPRDIADRMVDLAGPCYGQRILEPSAGTGVIADAVSEYCYARGINHELRMVEINELLCAALRQRPLGIVTRGDFLEFLAIDLGGKFDIVVMNPPFAHDAAGARGPADVAHILHAISLTKPGGRVVAICAGGPRQRDALEHLADSWEELPAGTFASAGTNVATVLAVFLVSKD
ncbi:MAG TPA: class I SAM-dependent methyltransferase, partial [Polyangiaceae bacterium]